MRLGRSELVSQKSVAYLVNNFSLSPTEAIVTHCQIVDRTTWVLAFSLENTLYPSKRVEQSETIPIPLPVPESTDEAPSSPLICYYLAEG